MENENKAPDYIGNGLAVWINTDKNGKKYLSVKVLNGKPINCFKNEPKEKKEKKETEL